MSHLHACTSTNGKTCSTNNFRKLLKEHHDQGEHESPGSRQHVTDESTMLRPYWWRKSRRRAPSHEELAQPSRKICLLVLAWSTCSASWRRCLAGLARSRPLSFIWARTCWCSSIQPNFCVSAFQEPDGGCGINAIYSTQVFCQPIPTESCHDAYD